jgi:hypothetical protein
MPKKQLFFEDLANIVRDGFTENDKKFKKIETLIEANSEGIRANTERIEKVLTMTADFFEHQQELFNGRFNDLTGHVNNLDTRMGDLVEVVGEKNKKIEARINRLERAVFIGQE